MKTKSPCQFLWMVAASLFVQNSMADPPPAPGSAVQARFSVPRMDHATNAPAKFETGKMGPLGFMKQQLNLTDDQARRLEPILKEQNKRWSAFRHEASLSRKERAAKLKQLQAQSDAELKTVLSPEQFEKWRHRGPRQRDPRQPQSAVQPARF